tara:strand:- start:14 stop:604 length:591 start_codon:yes stop_codon:yes gene_type:complete
MTVRVSKPEFNLREKISELDYSRVPYEKMPSGSIIQLVAGETEFRTATSSGTYQPTDMFATISPKFASSQIYITLGGDGNNNGTGNQMYMTYYRSIDGGSFSNLATNGRNDTTNIDQNYGFAMINGHNSRIHVPVAMPFLDTPNTIKPITYKVYIRKNTSVGSGSVEFPANDGYQRSRMFLFEIAGGGIESVAVGS